eukprot:365157-Chlamydomonas_euryale.AAC.27
MKKAVMVSGARPKREATDPIRATCHAPCRARIQRCIGIAVLSGVLSGVMLLDANSTPAHLRPAGRPDILFSLSPRPSANPTLPAPT